MRADTIVVLCVDALRAANLPFHGYDRQTGPFLADLADENLCFTACYSTSSHTREAVPSMLTGEYPLIAAGRSFELTARSVTERIPEPSAMFHSNPFLSRAYGFDRGFDAFSDDLALGRNRLYALARRALDKLTNRHYASAETINERAQRWFESESEPRFLWNHYMDVHGPYQPPGRYRTAFASTRVSNRRSQFLLQKAIRAPDRVTARERQQLVDLYDGSVRYVDEQLRSFFEWFRSTGRYDDTLVVVTADHGEALGEDGFYEHPRRLTERLLHVPLILAGGAVESSATVDVPVSLRDLAATVCGRLAPDADVPGTDLAAVAADPDAYRDRTVFAQVTKKRFAGAEFLARSAAATARATVDRDGAVRSSSGEGSVRRRLNGHLAAYANAVERKRGPNPVDAEIERRLRALGYLQDEE